MVHHGFALMMMMVMITIRLVADFPLTSPQSCLQLVADKPVGYLKSDEVGVMESGLFDKFLLRASMHRSLSIYTLTDARPIPVERYIKTL